MLSREIPWNRELVRQRRLARRRGEHLLVACALAQGGAGPRSKAISQAVLFKDKDITLVRTAAMMYVARVQDAWDVVERRLRSAQMDHRPEATAGAWLAYVAQVKAASDLCSGDCAQALEGFASGSPPRVVDGGAK